MGIDYVFLTFTLCRTFNKVTFSEFVTHLLAFIPPRSDRKTLRLSQVVVIISTNILLWNEGRCSSLAEKHIGDACLIKENIKLLV